MQSYEFDFAKHCIICAKRIHTNQAFSTLTNNESKQLVINYQTNNESLNSAIREIIIGKLLCQDEMNLLNAKYHRKSCSSQLRTENQNSRINTELNKKIKISMEEVFNYVDDNEENVFTLNDFQNLLNEKNMYVPSNNTIWSRLKNHYQEDILIVNKKGAPAHCCLRKRGYDFLHKNQQESAENSLDYSLINKVVKMISDEVKEHFTEDFSEYPASDNMFEKARVLPGKLKYLLEKLILNQFRKEKTLNFMIPK